MSNLGPSKAMTTSFPNLPSQVDASCSRLPESFQVSVQRERTVHAALPQSSSLGNSFSSSSRVPCDTHSSSLYPRERHSQTSPMSELPSGENSLLPTHSEIHSTPAGRFPDGNKDIAWCPNTIEEFLHFPENASDQNGLVDSSSGVIMSEDQADKTDWSDLFPSMSFEDALDPYWELSMDDIAAVVPKPEVSNPCSEILVQQSQIQQNHPHFQQNQPQAQQNQSQAQQNQSQIQQNPSQIQQNPSQIQQNPFQIQQNQSQIQQNPSQIQHNQLRVHQKHSQVQQIQPQIQLHQPQIQQEQPLLSAEYHASPEPSSTAQSTKSRMRWTQELHEAFVEAVNQLGGGERATPKGILNVMKVEGLTIYHVKSHLQKYRTARYKPESSEGPSEKNLTSVEEMNSIDLKTSSMGITEALRLQVELQKRLHEQLENQRKLQLQIEEQGKYLEKMFEQQRMIEDSRVKPTSSTLDEGNKGGSDTPLNEVSQDANVKQKEQESTIDDSHVPPIDDDTGVVPAKRARI